MELPFCRWQEISARDGGQLRCKHAQIRAPDRLVSSEICRSCSLREQVPAPEYASLCAHAAEEPDAARHVQTWAVGGATAPRRTPTLASTSRVTTTNNFTGPLRVTEALLNQHEPMIFRLSQKLSSKIGVGKLSEMPLSDNPFADWSANLFVADRTQYILLANTKSLYSTVLVGKGITDDGDFIDRALGSMRQLMELDGQQFIYRRFIAPASGTVRFAKALDRSVTGSMNELIHAAKSVLAGGELSPLDAGFRLNDVLLSAIAPSRAAKYGRPRDAFRSMAPEEATKQREEA